MRYLKTTQQDILMREIPGEVCLAFNISECPYKCKGCHSQELWSSTGDTLTFELLDEKIKKYLNGITCVLFMGDAGDIKNALPYFEYIKKNYKYLKTALYTGATDTQLKVSFHEFGNYDNTIDYIKVGPWKEDCGPLNDATTNQALYKVTVEQIKLS